MVTATLVRVTELQRHPSAAPQTLTFLFADLREYTTFVERFGDAAATTLIGDYRRIVRAEVARAGGGEVKTEGDSFYVVFSAARAAVACGIAILREAERYSRDRPDRAMRVGVGIHAGEPVPHEGQYVGAAVIVAARLAQQAQAGELLVSDVVRGLLPREVAPPMSEREGLLLKGIEHPPRAFAVSWQAVAEPRPAAPSPKEVAIEAPPPSRRILCPEIIGREGELSELAAHLSAASAGNGRTVLLAGEAGLGKSALVKVFVDRAASAGFRVLLGECTEVEARRPFGPFIDALRAASLPLPPELGQGAPGAQPVEELERYRVHAGFAKTIVDAATTAPLAVVIEDLHWADEATLELVPYLARKLRDQRVLLLGTYRSDELHRLHPLNHLLAELSRGRLAEEVRLRRLTEDETAAVIRAALRLGRAPTTAFRQAIHERCEGNPFFIEEVLRALVEGGDLSYREGAWRRTKEVAELAIPVSVRDAVQQRLRALTADARRAIQVAAVIGQRFDFDLLQRVSRIAEPALLEAIRTAVEEQLVEEERGVDVEESYRFRHALTRESVLAELLQRERRLLHRAVGEALEQRAGTRAERYAEELAYHFDQARDRERAFRYHELAARESLRVFAFSRAVGHLDRAVDLAADDQPSLAEVHLRLAEAALQANDLARGLRAAEEARAIAQASANIRLTGVALRVIALFRWYFGDTQAAAAAADEAIALLEPLGPSPELAAAYAERARLAMLDEGDDRKTVEIGERAIQMAKSAGDLVAEVSATTTVGTTLARTKATAREGIALLRRSLSLALDHQLVGDAQRAYQNLWAASWVAGLGASEARRIHEEGLAHARRHGLRTQPLLGRESIYAYGDGDWDRVLALTDEGRDGSIWSAARELLEAVVRTAREGPAAGLPLSEVPRRRLLAAGSHQWVASAARSIDALFIAERDEEALRHAEALAPLLPAGWSGNIPSVAVSALAAALRSGDRQQGERWVALGRTIGTERGPMVGDAPAHAFVEGAAALLAGDSATALGRFADCARLASDPDWTFFMPKTLAHLQRAELLVRSGDQAAGQLELDAALPFWRKAKATWYLGRLAEWARERGLTVAT